MKVTTFIFKNQRSVLTSTLVIEYPDFDYKKVLDLSASLLTSLQIYSRAEIAMSRQLDAFTADGCQLYQKALREGSEEPVGPILLGNDRLLGERKCELTVGELWKVSQQYIRLDLRLDLISIRFEQLHAQKTLYTNSQLALWQSTAKLTKNGKPIDGLITPVGAHT
jgi:hypothetical protein